jgi:hypothetical protein
MSRSFIAYHDSEDWYDHALWSAREPIGCRRRYDWGSGEVAVPRTRRRRGNAGMVPGSSCSSFRHPLSRSFASSRTTGTWGGLAAILPTLGPARSIAFSILTIRGARPSLFSIRRQESCYSASRSRASPLVPHPGTSRKKRRRGPSATCILMRD